MIRNVHWTDIVSYLPKTASGELGTKYGENGNRGGGDYVNFNIEQVVLDVAEVGTYCAFGFNSRPYFQYEAYTPASQNNKQTVWVDNAYFVVKVNSKIVWQWGFSRTINDDTLGHKLGTYSCDDAPFIVIDDPLILSQNDSNHLTMEYHVFTRVAPRQSIGGGMAWNNLIFPKVEIEYYEEPGRWSY